MTRPGTFRTRWRLPSRREDRAVLERQPPERWSAGRSHSHPLGRPGPNPSSAGPARRARASPAPASGAGLPSSRAPVPSASIVDELVVDGLAEDLAAVRPAVESAVVARAGAQRVTL